MSSLSSKYVNLSIAEKAGLNVPKTLLLEEDIDESIINGFITSCNPDSLFIIRSIQACEDGEGLSYAGHFWSSPKVKANQIKENRTLATQENQKILDKLGSTEKPQLMLQEFIEHSIGGVLFTPWSFFSDYSYIEYSTEGVQQAVEGRIESAILNHHNEYDSPLPLPIKLKTLVKPLQSICPQLQSLFQFPFDCEWAYCNKSQQIVILQVRPQTTLVGPILGAPKNSENSNLEKGDWRYTALSESLGRLSPLSFSLLLTLYEDTKESFQSLGFIAKKVNFMKRFPDGTILSNPQTESEFYASTKMGGFWRGFRAPKWQQKCNDYLKNLNPDSKFSYSQLSQLFQFWMVANLLSHGKDRDQQLRQHAYKLTWQQSITQPVINTETKNWGQLNPLLRKLFFFELEKLKKELSKKPGQAFSSWQEFGEESNDSQFLERQYSDAQLAVYDYSMIANKNNNDAMQSIGARKKVSGTLFVIQNPAQFHQQIPENSILITPYFSNQWVHEIKHLSAIIVEQGGQLSHSAIIARECGVPYFIANISSFVKTGHNANVVIDIDGSISIKDK